MHIAEYQAWIRTYDLARDFDRVLPSQTLVHAVEEFGEIAREVLYLEGYKEAADLTLRQAALAEELADCVIFLFKLAYQFDIDMEAALIASQSKADARYGVEDGRALAARYLARQRENRERRLEHAVRQESGKMQAGNL